MVLIETNLNVALDKLARILPADLVAQCSSANSEINVDKPTSRAMSIVRAATVYIAQLDIHLVKLMKSEEGITSVRDTKCKGK